MTDKLTENEISTYKDAFNLFDKDGNGTITLPELSIIIQSLGVSISEVDQESVLNNGTIDFNDFLSVISTKKNISSETELISAFKVFDKYGRGFITETELLHIMTNLGEELSKDDALLMIREADINGHGKIYYEDFVKIILEGD
jgi:calmodulin